LDDAARSAIVHGAAHAAAPPRSGQTAVAVVQSRSRRPPAARPVRAPTSTRPLRTAAQIDDDALQNALDPESYAAASSAIARRIGSGSIAMTTVTAPR
jgi:hypothetical protein